MKYRDSVGTSATIGVCVYDGAEGVAFDDLPEPPPRPPPDVTFDGGEIRISGSYVDIDFDEGMTVGGTWDGKRLTRSILNAMPAWQGWVDVVETALKEAGK